MSQFPPVNQDGSPFHAGLPDDVTLSPAIYQASLDPRVLALLQMPNANGPEQAARVAQAIVLKSEGLTIDMQLVMWTWDPTTVMYLRKTAGLVAVPDMFGTPNAIKVSVDAEDFPAFAGAPPPVPTQSTNLVGLSQGFGIYASGPGVITSPPSALNVTPGEQVTQNGITYTAHVGMSLMGPSVYFTKN